MFTKLSELKVSNDKEIKSNSFVEKLNNRRRHLSTISFKLSKNEDLISHYKKMMETISDPNFNIFHFQNTLNLNKSSLMYTISNYIFEQLGFYKEKIISKNKLKSFTNKVVSLYKSNPYHNIIHACDVLQTCYIIISKGNFLSKKIFNSLDLSSLLIASMIHDIGHPGLSNVYQKNKKTEIGLLYNESPLENMHIKKGIEILENDKYNIFENLNFDDFEIIKKRIISGILMTDGSKHNQLIKEMESTIEKIKSFSAQNEKNLIDKFSEVISNKKIQENEIFNIQQTLYNFILHSSDISNPSKKFEIYSKWTDFVTTEFFNEGDLEKLENLPVNFLCDRETTNIPKSQISFINFIVLPDFKLLSTIIPECSIYVDNCKDNINEWNEKLNKEN